ncbi:GtrA family protein [Pseudonocardia sp. ICBG1293]|uniref:GtrA family protein n=1 Tax=Pseudonocardia sp. ICBG1293 TaxID=2844382 RepID=UPI001CCC6C8F|nr:GtrA family protein [Pseudonocardia sp. ICBG1293]
MDAAHSSAHGSFVDPVPSAARVHGRVAAVVADLSRRYPLAVQLARYAAVGGGATALNAALFLLFRPVLPAVPANLLALVLTTAVSTEASRRLAFDGAPAHRLREWVQDAGTVAFYATYTSAVLLALHQLAGATTPGEEAAVVAVASLAGGLLRFAVLRFWVFDVARPAAAGALPDQGGRHPCPEQSSSTPST